MTLLKGKRQSLEGQAKMRLAQPLLLRTTPGSLNAIKLLQCVYPVYRLNTSHFFRSSHIICDTSLESKDVKQLLLRDQNVYQVSQTTVAEWKV